MDIMRKHFFEPPPSLPQWRPDCPPALAGAITRMLAKEPEERWPSVEEAIGAMGAQSLGHDDPVRTQMIELAKSGIKPVARLPVPSSPAPVGRPSSPGTGPPAARQPAPAAPAAPRRGMSKALRWGAVLTVLAGVAVAARVALRPNRTTREPAPAVATDSVAAVAIRGTPDHLDVGGTVRLTATATGVRGDVMPAAPMRWSTSDSQVVRVTEEGVVTGLAVGSAFVTAASGGRHDSARVTVREPPMASLEVVPSAVRLGIRQSLQLTLFAADGRGHRSPVSEAAWSSGTPSVANVSGGGVVTALAPGVAMLTVSSGALRASVRVTVVIPAVASLAISPGTAQLRVGDSLRMRAAALDASGQQLTGRAVVWGSSDRTIVEMSPSGVITGVSPGSAGVTAMAEGVKSDRATIFVSAPAPPTPLAPATLQLLVVPYANVSIDGHGWGQRERLEQTLAAGIHRLRFEREGFATVDTSVTLNPNETRLVRIQMTRSR
jgi:hypothetical protein